MSDISTLLQEAKPLYFKRKKRRRQLKIAAGVVGCLMVGVLVAGAPKLRPMSTNDFDMFYAYLYDDTAYQRIVGTSDSYNYDSDSLWFDGYELAQVI